MRSTQVFLRRIRTTSVASSFFSRPITSLKCTSAPGTIVLAAQASDESRHSNSLYTVMSLVVGLTVWTTCKRKIQCEQAEQPVENAKIYTREEVARHNSQTSRVWVTYGDDVYDVTDFLPNHPGGSEKLMLAAGKAVEPFWNVYRGHYASSRAMDILSTLKIGTLHPDDVAARDKEPFDDYDPYENEPSVSPLLRVHQLNPARAEPPATLLGMQWITPTNMMFIRNHHPVPLFKDPDNFLITVKIPEAALRTEPQHQRLLHNKEQESVADGYKHVTYSVADLKDPQKFRQATIVSSIQCGGNRRAAMDAYGDSGGIQWDVGAMHTGRWTGVWLRDLLADAGLDVNEYLLTGKEQPFQHCQFGAVDGLEVSIPLDKAIAPKGDVLVAHTLNNAPIPEMFGHPLRAIVPGYVGVRNAKWVNSVKVSEEEAKGTWQRGLAYKGFGPSVKSAEGIDVAKIQSLQEQPVNSAITVPMNGTVISPGRNKIHGYAYSGGGRGIVRVDVSIDGGNNWVTASLKEGSEQPMHRAWAWTLWECDVDIPATNESIEMICKATDASYNVQPDTIKPIWNLRSINNNAWHRIRIHVDRENQK